MRRMGLSRDARPLTLDAATFHRWMRPRAEQLRKLRCAVPLAFMAWAAAPSVAHAVEWPTRPVTIVVPFVPGGNTDMMARLAAERLAAKFGQPFIVENRAGAGGITAAGQVARAAPDGYTVLFGAGSQLTLAPLIQKVGYDPDKDLIPATEFGTGPVILGVKGDMPVATLQDFIDYVKARPAKLSYASVGVQTVGKGTTRLRGGWGNRGTTQVIQDIKDGKISTTGLKYHEIAARYSGRGPELANAIDIFQRTGVAPAGFSHNEIASLFFLVHGVEPGLRSPAAGPQAEMMKDLMRAGRSTEDVLGRDEKGGLFPMSPRGAVAEAKATDQYFESKAKGEKPEMTTAVSNHINREIALVEAWVATLDLVFDDAATERNKVDEVKRQITKRILGAAETGKS